MPITRDLIKLIIADQREERTIPKSYIKRTAESKLLELSLDKEITVLTGLRRSGKSVLLHYIRQKSTESDYYFNFEDDRLAEFTINDFQTLLEVFIELFGIQNTFYFDEIQNVHGWEMFIRRLYNYGHKIYITGSNANLFSEELGTRLTGRYIPVSVYPVSFKEYLKYKDDSLLHNKLLSTSKIGQIKKIFSNYCMEGGIPEYIKHKKIDYLHTLYESIIYRDIVTRYKLPNAVLIKKLVFYLASNCSKETTYNSLKKLFDVGSSTTISDYCHYLENSYLCFFINRYSDSVKSQLQSPKKVYFIDPAIAKMLGFKISEDNGRTLENIVFLELKRNNHEIYYHRDLKECDFIIREGARTTQAIQVCKEMTEPKTKQREIDGLIETLIRFSLKEGLIITENDEYTENIKKEGKSFKIVVIPIWKWLAFSN
jgi:predicted AAA+ superfamily ATPase